MILFTFFCPRQTKTNWCHFLMFCIPIIDQSREASPQKLTNLWPFPSVSIVDVSLTLLNKFRLCSCLHLKPFLLPFSASSSGRFFMLHSWPYNGCHNKNYELLNFLDIILTISLQIYMISNLIIDSKENSLLTFPSSLQRCYYFFASSKNWNDDNYLNHLCVNHFVSALRLNQFTKLYFCCITPTLVLIVRTVQENNSIESFYTRTTYLFWHDVKKLHRLISDDLTKNNDMVILLNQSSPMG